LLVFLANRERERERKKERTGIEREREKKEKEGTLTEREREGTLKFFLGQYLDFIFPFFRSTESHGKTC